MTDFFPHFFFAEVFTLYSKHTCQNLKYPSKVHHWKNNTKQIRFQSKYCWLQLFLTFFSKKHYFLPLEYSLTAESKPSVKGTHWTIQKSPTNSRDSATNFILNILSLPFSARTNAIIPLKQSFFYKNMNSKFAYFFKFPQHYFSFLLKITF